MMIAEQPIVNANRTPTFEFIALWRAAGALQGLPRWMVIANPDGTPTPKFLSLARVAFNLTPAINLNAAAQMITVDPEGGPTDGTPTLAMRNAWLTWTS